VEEEQQVEGEKIGFVGGDGGLEEGDEATTSSNARFINTEMEDIESRRLTT